MKNIEKKENISAGDFVIAGVISLLSIVVFYYATSLLIMKLHPLLVVSLSAFVASVFSVLILEILRFLRRFCNK